MEPTRETLTHAEIQDYSSRYIAIEGPDGVGKTGAVNELVASLKKRYGDGKIVQIREPGHTAVGAQIRALTKNPEHIGALSNKALALLFAVDRIVTFETITLPALKAGNIVLSDRSFWSSLVYQVKVGGFDSPLFDDIHDYALQGVKPGLVAVFNTDFSVAQSRNKSRIENGGEALDRFDLAGDDAKRAIHRAFYQMCEDHPQNCRLIDTSVSEAEVAAKAIKVVKEYFDTLDAFKTQNIEEATAGQKPTIRKIRKPR